MGPIEIRLLMGQIEATGLALGPPSIRVGHRAEAPDSECASSAC